MKASSRSINGPILQFALLSMLLASAGHSLQGQPKILFIGNSFTATTDPTVPQMVAGLARAGGHPDPHVVTRVNGGADYHHHTSYFVSQDVIKSEQWDYVVMQNNSLQPTHIGSISDHMTYGTLLYNQIMANNPETQVVIYETWSYAAAHALFTGISSPTTFASTTEMQGELCTNYALLADQLNAANPGNPPVVVAHCGTAWESAGALLPASNPDYVNLFAGDLFHGNQHGYYLSASVIYATIYGSSPAGLHSLPQIKSLNNLSLSDLAGYLEQVAWDTYTANSGEVPLAFVSQPADASATVLGTATFAVSVRGGQPPYQSVQWYADAEPIAGAHALTLTLPSVTPAMGGTVYTVSVFDGTSTITSEGARLIISTDLEPPVIAGADASADGTTLTLEFSEAMSAGPATTLSNFSVYSEGTAIPLTSVTLSTDGTVLTLSLGAPAFREFVATVAAAVTDLAGNPLAQGTTASGPVAGPLSDGAVYLVDFNTAGYSGYPDASKWNIYDTPSTVAGTLIDSSGGASSLVISLSGEVADDPTFPSLTGGPAWIFNPTNYWTAAGTMGSGVSTAAADCFSTSTTYTVAVAGLAGTAFALDVLGGGSYSSQIWNGNFSYSLDGGATWQGFMAINADGSVRVPDTSLPAGTISAYRARQGVTMTLAGATETAILAGGTDVLLLKVSNAADSVASGFNALRLVTRSKDIPEPARFSTCQMQGGALLLDWTSIGRLDTAPSPAGPWTAVVPASQPPHAAPLPAADACFYRLTSP